MYVFLLVAMIDFELVSTWDLAQYDLFDVRPVFAVTDDGGIAFADPDEHQIVVLDELGQHSRRFGRKGEGPGEFANIWFIRWNRTHRHFVILDWGNRRIAFWSRQGTMIKELQIANYIPAATLMGPTTLVYSVNEHARDGDPSLAVLDLETGLSTGLWAHKPAAPGNLHAYYMGKGFMVPVVAWHPKLVFDRGSDFIAASFGATQKVDIVDFRGKILSSFDSGLPRFPLTDGHVRAQLPGYEPAKRKAIAKQEKRPKYQPTTQALSVDDKDRVWLFGHSREAGGDVPVRVFDREGRLRAEGEVARIPSVVHDNLLYALVENEDGDFFMERISFRLDPRPQ